MKFYKKLTALIMSACLLLCTFAGSALALSKERTIPTPEVPDGYDGYVVLSFEALPLGYGFIVEPTLVPFHAGDSVAQLVVNLMNEKGIEIAYGGGIEGFYLQKVACEALANGVEPSIPDYLMTVLTENYCWDAEDGWDNPEDGDGMLGEFDYTQYSGWMYTVNDVSASVGAGSHTAVNGEVYRFMYSIYGWGMDIGISDGWGMFAPFDNPAYEVERSAAYSLWASVNANDELSARISLGGDAFGAFRDFSAAMSYVGSAQQDIDAAYEALEAKLNSEPIMMGDVDGDDAVAAVDATLILRHAMQLITLDEAYLEAADIDFDGSVNAVDAVLALRIALGTLH